MKSAYIVSIYFYLHECHDTILIFGYIYDEYFK